MKWSGGRKESLREDVNKVGEERRDGRRKRSEAELEVRKQAGVCVCVCVGRGGKQGENKGVSSGGKTAYCIPRDQVKSEGWQSSEEGKKTNKQQQAVMAGGGAEPFHAQHGQVVMESRKY